MGIEKPRRNSEMPQLERIHEWSAKIEKSKEALQIAKNLGREDTRSSLEDEIRQEQEKLRKLLQEQRQMLERQLQSWQREQRTLEEGLARIREAGLSVGGLESKVNEAKEEQAKIEQRLREVSEALG